MESRDLLKRSAAEAAVKLIKTPLILGVGTGSTVNCLIEMLPQVKNRLKAVVASSKETARRLAECGFTPKTPNEIEAVDLYIDGADEIDSELHMIKGGGAALTGEKIVSSMAKKFICIADASKKVMTLGKFPLPLEVLPFAREVVLRALKKIGGDPEVRANTITDYGNIIIDVKQLKITDPKFLEAELNNLPGVVTCGLFALRGADLLLLGTESGVQVYKSHEAE